MGLASPPACRTSSTKDVPGGLRLGTEHPDEHPVSVCLLNNQPLLAYYVIPMGNRRAPTGAKALLCTAVISQANCS